MNRTISSVSARLGMAVVGALLLAGCSGGNTLDVRGSVTFDGAPIEQGEISFVPTSGAPDGGVIDHGEFQFEAKPGRKRVEIRASRPLPPERQNNPEMGLLYEDYIPARYNRDSTLTAEVSAEDQRVYQFDLASRPE